MVTKALLIGLLAVFPLGQLGRVEFGNSIAVSALDLTIFLTVLWWSINHIYQKSSFPRTKLGIPLFLFITAAFLSLIMNKLNLNFIDLFISSLYLIRFVFYTGVYFVIREQDALFQKIYFVGMLISGFVIVVGGFIQYFLYSDLRNLYYAGWDEHLYRMFSSFLDPNFASAFFVLELLLIGSLLFQKATNKSWVRVSLIGMAILTFAAILLTYSRGGFLMLFVSMFLFLVFSNQKKLIVGFILLFIVGILLLPKDLPSVGVNLFRTASVVARGEEAQNAVTIIKDNLVFGVGFNAYRFAKRSYGFLGEDNWQTVHSGAGTDNSILFILATTGIVGFLSYLFLWYRTLLIGKTALFQNDRFRRSLGIVLLCAMGGLFANSFFINSLFYPHILIFMWFIIGLTEKG